MSWEGRGCHGAPLGGLRGRISSSRCRRRRSLLPPVLTPSSCSQTVLPGREFVEQILPHFQRDNPQLAVETVVQRGKHPGLLGEYRELPLDAVPPPACLLPATSAVCSAAAAWPAIDSLAALPCLPGLPHLPWQLQTCAVHRALPPCHPTPPLRRPAVRPAVNTSTRHVDLRNAAPEEVLRQAVYLRSSLGRKASLQVRRGGGFGHHSRCSAAAVVVRAADRLAMLWWVLWILRMLAACLGRYNGFW